MACRFPAARVALVALLWARAPAGPSGSPTPESADYVPMPGRADLPFSAMVGPMLYLSGQLGMLADMAEWGQ